MEDIIDLDSIGQPRTFLPSRTQAASDCLETDWPLPIISKCFTSCKHIQDLEVLFHARGHVSSNVVKSNFR